MHALYRTQPHILLLFFLLILTCKACTALPSAGFLGVFLLLGLGAVPFCSPKRCKPGSLSIQWSGPSCPNKVYFLKLTLRMEIISKRCKKRSSTSLSSKMNSIQVNQVNNITKIGLRLLLLLRWKDIISLGMRAIPIESLSRKRIIHYYENLNL